MPQAAVRAHLDVTLDVHRDLFTKVAFYRALFFQNLTDLVDFVFGQLADLLIELDACAMEERTRTGTAHAVNIRQPDLSSLSSRQIHTSDTCHMFTLAS